MPTLALQMAVSLKFTCSYYYPTPSCSPSCCTNCSSAHYSLHYFTYFICSYYPPPLPRSPSCCASCSAASCFDHAIVTQYHLLILPTHFLSPAQSILLRKLQRCLEDHGALLVAERLEREQRESTRQLMQQQNAEYEAALAADQQREAEQQEQQALQQQEERLRWGCERCVAGLPLHSRVCGCRICCLMFWSDEKMEIKGTEWGGVGGSMYLLPCDVMLVSRKDTCCVEWPSTMRLSYCILGANHANCSSLTIRQQEEERLRAESEAVAKRKADHAAAIVQRRQQKRLQLTAEPAEGEPSAQVRIRMPDGSAHQRKFHPQRPLQVRRGLARYINHPTAII